MTQKTAIRIEPTLPGKVEGIICMDPITVQCQVCGKKDDWTTLGLSERNRTGNLVIMCSSIKFCRGKSPRRCADCRKASGCTCPMCREQFGQGRS